MSSLFHPFAEMDRLHDQLFRATLGGRPEPRAAYTPPVDIREDESGLLVEVELPGVKLSDVDVKVENDTLTLTGERKPEHQDGHFRRERWHGAFARSFRLPRTVDVSKIEASFKDGVLTVRMPKRDELRARKIEIKS